MDHLTVVTGAGGGIGREIASQLSTAGHAVWLVDNDAERLGETALACRHNQTRVRTTRLDVTDYAAVNQFAAAVAGKGTVHALYNAAGVIHAGLLTDSRMVDIERVVSVDLLGTIAVSQALTPGLVQSGHGRIINVSSAFGLAAVPGYTAYCAAKFGVRGFSEALQQELAPSHVAVTAVYPGGVQTGIMRRGTYGATVTPAEIQDRFDRAVARTTPAAAAQQIIQGAARGRRRILVGADARAVDVVVRVVGARYQYLSRRVGMRLDQRKGDSDVQPMAARGDVRPGD